MKIKVPWRAQMLGFSTLLFFISIGFAIATYSDFSTLAKLIRARSPLIEIDHYTTTLAVFCPAALTLGLIFFLSKPAGASVPRRKMSAQQRKADEKAFQRGKWYILYLFISILAALFAPIPQFFIINHIATERGYTYCPASLFSRREPDRWALPGPRSETERCPREGAKTAKP